MDANRTEPEGDLESRRRGERPRVVHALVIIWSGEPQTRLGESLVFASNKPSGVRVFGRGEGGPDDPHPRLQLSRLRPMGVQPAATLDNPHVSRVQWMLRVIDDERFAIDNVGLCPLFHNGEQARSVEVRAGDTVRLGQQMAFVAVKRTLDAFAAPAGFESVEFGHADAHGIVGESSAIWSLRRDLSFLGPRAGHVLVHGASGTGKELVARAIHRLSQRAAKPLVSRNAATFPEGIIDAELFGNAKNYPNPGMADRPGLVGQAHESTLFLDELAELPLALQTHLLRVLDGGEYQRLGEATARCADFRLIAATNGPPSDIRHDIRARFEFSLDLAGLPDRREDVPLILRHLLRDMARSDRAVMRMLFPNGLDADPRLPVQWVEALVRRRYLTHCRELRNLAWKAIGAERGSELTARSALATLERPPSPDGAAPPERAGGAMRAEDIQACLDRHNGVIEKAWRELGLKNRHALARLISKYGLEVRRRSSTVARAGRHRN
jgi:DNA-binding NtrC family response regulator